MKQLVLLFSLMSMATSCAWGADRPTPETFIYKEAAGLRIAMDVYRNGESQSQPAILWIHGGALIGGRREGIRTDQLKAYLDAGYVVASIDYRLAPESKLPDIAADLRDAFHWLREEGPKIAGVDPERIAAVGHSAGGYLALLAGSIVDPPPQAIVSFYGYGDIVGDWYAKPDPFYLQQPLVTEEEALASVGTAPLASDKGWPKDRFRFYLYCRQQGLWPEQIGGVSPGEDPNFFTPYCPVKNITKDQPPTLLIHGDADTDVPVEQSLMMAEALKEKGAPVRTLILEGAGHGFDGRGIGKDPHADRAFEAVMEFLRERVQGTTTTRTEKDFPPLPAGNGSVQIPTQEWPLDPGPRTVRVYLHYPGGSLAKVNEETGVMLSLHNWGGTHRVGTADPDILANRYNVIAVCVDYLQSGDWQATGKPYDHGLYQAVDALRALHFVRQSLRDEGVPHHPGRIYACGGSGGGNVAMTAAKLAPGAFACVVGMSGMAKLSEDVAYGEEGGSPLNAGYSRDPNHPHHLSAAGQEIRFIGNPAHLEAMMGGGCETHFVLVHGARDDVCPTAEARELAANLEAAGFSVEAHFIGEDDLDGEVFTDTGHSVGDRTRILQKVADPHLLPSSETMKGLGEDRAAPVRFTVTGGEFRLEYGADGPALRFEPTPQSVTAP